MSFIAALDVQAAALARIVDQFAIMCSGLAL